MSPKAAAGVYTLWIVLFIFASAMDGFMVVSGRESLLDSMISGQITRVQGAGILDIPFIAIGLTQAFWSMLVWDFPFLSNDVGLMLKLVLLYPVSLGGMVGFTTFIIPVLSSKVGLIAVAGGIVTAAGVALAAIFGF